MPLVASAVLLAFLAADPPGGDVRGSLSAAETSTRAGLAEGRIDTPFSVEADRLLREGRVHIAEGRVVVERPGSRLLADRVTLDEGAGVVTAEGDVTLVEGRTVLRCRRLALLLPHLALEIDRAELRIKSEATDLNAALVAPERGEDEIIVEARALERKERRRFRVTGGSFTPCDCGEEETPSWRIEASEASVDLDSGAWLEWPVFYVRDVPIFALPAFYVPLGERRTGFLLPRPSFSSVTGPAVKEPFYLALDRSWDATLEAAYLSRRGVGAGVELRWAPTSSSAGELDGTLILDYGRFGPRDPEDPSSVGWSKSRSAPVPRYALGGRHKTGLRSGAVAAELNLFGDPAFLEFEDAFLVRQAEHATSRLAWTGASGPEVRHALGVHLLQDLRPETYLAAGRELREIRLLSGEIPGPGTVRYRFLELRLDALPHALFEGSLPLLGEARLSAQVFAAPRPEVARFVRADLRPSLSVPIQLPLGLTFEPSTAGRLTAWGGRLDSEQVTQTRFAWIAGARLFSSFARRFGGVVHRVAPELAYLAIPVVHAAGDDAFSTRDEIDLLKEVSQARVRLRTDLWGLERGRIAGLDLWIGRDLAPLRGGAGAGTSELVTRGDFLVSPAAWPIDLVLDGKAAIDVGARAITEAAGGVSVASRRGDALSASFGRFGERMPAHTFVAPEEIVPSRTIDRAAYVPFLDLERGVAPEARVDLKPWSSFSGAAISLRARPIEPLTIALGVGLSFDDPELVSAAYGAGASTSPIRNVSGEVQWVSPCDCWSVALAAGTARDRPGFDVQLSVDLARLGGTSAGPD